MELNPSVIDQKLLETAIKEQSKQGETRRLSQEHPVDWGTVLSVRLEFQGILKIDHLWMLKNLTKLSLNYNKIDTIENLSSLTQLVELDLSFNYIERIQNLDKLLRLEVLSLFSNRIQTIENLEHLKELLILNLGANKIGSLDGFERLRFLPKLKVFNLERNPLQELMDVRQVVSAYLPKLKYYNYTHLTQDEKDAAAQVYSRELRDLNEREQLEIARYQREAVMAENQSHDFNCFMEELSGHELFDQLFLDENYEDIPSDIKSEFKDQMFVLTQGIYHAGLTRFHEREKEVEEFRKCLDAAKRVNQQKGQRIIRDIQKQEHPSSTLIDKAWTELMEMEVQLFESIEDVSKSFRHVLGDLINDFLNEAQSIFRQIKELIDKFSEELVVVMKAKRIGVSCPDGYDSQAKEYVQSLWKKQRKTIEDREHRLQYRARKWTRDILNQFKEEEIERNRRKIIEINYFFDSIRAFLAHPGQVGIVLK